MDWFTIWLGSLVRWLAFLAPTKLWATVLVIVMVAAPLGWAETNLWRWQNIICGEQCQPDLPGPKVDPGPSVPPNPGATPELDSLLLFGAGGVGMGGYALTRLRAG